MTVNAGAPGVVNNMHGDPLLVTWKRL